MKKSIKVKFYQEIKPGTILRAITTGLEAVPFLMILDETPVGVFGWIENKGGKTYLVWDQV